jgi:hypothetical protein
MKNFFNLVGQWIKDVLVIAWKWVVWSSADPAKTSLTIKALLVSGVTYLTVVFQFANINMGSFEMNVLIDGIVSFIQAILMVVSTATALFGLLRKSYKTIKGENPVIQ